MIKKSCLTKKLNASELKVYFESNPKYYRRLQYRLVIITQQLKQNYNDDDNVTYKH